jgi:hypothetical protein
MKQLRVLVACEYSGTVRDAFIARGHDAMSCDLLPTDVPGPHYQGDVFDIIGNGFDLMIAHPPCTYLTVSANKWLKDQPPRKSGVLVGEARRNARESAWIFFKALWDCGIPKICIENPVGILKSRFRQPDQVIQPWMFGHGETKATCLWLRGFPLLQPTHRKDDLFCLPEPKERVQRLHNLPPSAYRWKLRSTTYAGIAAAMADQWGGN